MKRDSLTCGTELGSRLWRWARSTIAWIANSAAADRGRELKLQESLSLGDRRFVGVLTCGSQRFLIGATASSISLLTELTTSQGPSSAAAAGGR